MSKTLPGLVCFAVTLGFVAFGDEVSRTGSQPSERLILVAQKKPRAKKAAPKKEAAKEKESEPSPAPAPAAAGDSDLKFSKDIAPIIVSNCLGCHNEKEKKGKLDLTTFDRMMTGTPKEKIIEPGNAQESHLIRRLRGIEKPKMPQGGNRNLAEEAIEKIEKWVQAGAVLDKGIDKSAPLESYASTPEQLRKAELAKMKPEERDKKVETVGLERWKKASPKVTPLVTHSKSFLLFGVLPKKRADDALKVMEREHMQLRSLLGPGVGDWGEKASLYVFNDRNSFVEFVRTLENREVEADEQGTANFSTPQPYVAVIDPYHGGEEPTVSRRARKKDDEGPTVDRNLAAALTEYFTIGEVARAGSGKEPTWLKLGLGAYLASKVDPRSTYIQKLRSSAYGLAEQGWAPKANDALGGQTKPEDIRAVGFAILDWIGAVAGPALRPFVKGMLAGGEKLDDVVGNVLNLNREQFLTGSSNYIGARYGRRR